MSKVMDAVDQVRSEAQNLDKQIDASTAKSHATIRTDLQDCATQAQRLASTLRTLAKDRQADVAQHLEHAASQLEAAASGAKTVASAADADLRQTNFAMLERTRDALQDISQAVAAKRAAVK